MPSHGQQSGDSANRGQRGAGGQQGSAPGRPLQGNYWATLLIAILALSPFIVVTTAYVLYRDQVAADIGANLTGLAVISGIATAGYAFGALLGGDLIQRFPQRRLFFICEGLFAAGCVIAAAAGGTISYGAGRVLMGFATGLLLVIALPPVVRNFPPERMPITSAVVNIGFFGAVTAGPLLGGAVAHGHVWRWFYGGLAGIAAAVLVAAILTLPRQPPPNPGMPFDWHAVLLAAAGTVLPFWATGELTGHGFGSFLFTVPLAVGGACFIALLLIEYGKEQPLSPVKPMWKTIPVTGILAAMAGGGAFVAFLALTEEYLLRVEHRTPLAAGLALWPQLAAVILTAALLGLLVRTRFLPLYTLAGMLLLIGGGALLLGLGGPRSTGTVLAGAGLLGLGAGATVSPGLWMAGFSLPSKMVGRTFALVELVRSEADFILAPVMLQVAQAGSAGAGVSTRGIENATWYMLLITIGSTVLGVALYLAGGAGLPAPDLQGWLKEERPAFESPPMLSRLRGGG